MKKNHFPPCGVIQPYAIIRTVAPDKDNRGRENERNYNNEQRRTERNPRQPQEAAQ